MSYRGLRELCNKLIGTWYCEEINECFTFHLNESIFHTESKLTVINKSSKFKAFDVHYGVGTYIGDIAEDFKTNKPVNDKYYIDIGYFNKRYYKIEEITKEKLVLREYWMILDSQPSELTLTYKRITDLSAADDILKGLDLNE